MDVYLCQYVVNQVAMYLSKMNLRVIDCELSGLIV